MGGDRSRGGIRASANSGSTKVEKTLHHPPRQGSTGRLSRELPSLPTIVGVSGRTLLQTSIEAFPPSQYGVIRKYGADKYLVRGERTNMTSSGACSCRCLRMMHSLDGETQRHETYVSKKRRGDALSSAMRLYDVSETPHLSTSV